MATSGDFPVRGFGAGAVRFLIERGFGPPVTIVVPPGPPNIDPANAIDITLPTTITIDLHDAQTTGLWYKWTPTVASNPIYVGAKVLPNPPDELAEFTPYIGITLQPINGYGSYTIDSSELEQFPAVLGNTYYFKIFAGTPVTASQTVSVSLAVPPQQTIQPGDFLFPDVDFGLPGTAMDHSGAVIRAFPYAAGTNVEILPSNATVISARGSDSHEHATNIYDANLNLVTTISYGASEFSYVVATDQTSTFYVLTNTSPPANHTVYGYTATGATVRTWTIDVSAARIAVNPGGTILYWGADLVTGPIHRHDLGTDTPLSNLVAGVSGYKPQAITTLSNGDVVVGYQDPVTASNSFVRLYSSAGATLHDYAAGSAVSGYFFAWIARNAADATSFWVVLEADGSIPFLSPSGLLKRISTSTGSVVETVSYDLFVQGSPGNNTNASFGPSAGQPVVFYAPVVPPPPTPTLIIAKEAQGTFTQGQLNASYLLVVSNNGTGPTTAATTVIEALPQGLALVSMSGVGWSCTGTTCMRSDALAAGASFPPITVTVNVASNAVSPQVNTATASTPGTTGTVTISTPIAHPGSPQAACVDTFPLE
jgi:hypothetical protein